MTRDLWMLERKTLLQDFGGSGQALGAKSLHKDQKNLHAMASRSSPFGPSSTGSLHEKLLILFLMHTRISQQHNITLGWKSGKSWKSQLCSGHPKGLGTCLQCSGHPKGLGICLSGPLSEKRETGEALPRHHASGPLS